MEEPNLFVSLLHAVQSFSWNGSSTDLILYFFKSDEYFAKVLLADINLFEWIEYFFFLYNSLAATSKQIDKFLPFVKPEILID